MRKPHVKAPSDQDKGVYHNDHYNTNSVDNFAPHQEHSPHGINQSAARRRNQIIKFLITGITLF